jgi:paxillin
MDDLDLLLSSLGDITPTQKAPPPKKGGGGLNDLMSELGVNASTNKDDHLMGLMADLDAFSMPSSSKNQQQKGGNSSMAKSEASTSLATEDLDNLLNDLDVEITGKSGTKPQPSRFTVTSNELDSLMMDLGGGSSNNNKGKTNAPASGAGAKGQSAHDDLDSLMNDLSGLSFDNSKPTNTKTPPPSHRNTTFELDSLMNDLASPKPSATANNTNTNTNTKTQTQTKSGLDDLDDLMKDLSGGGTPPPSRSNNNVRSTTNELDSLMNDLSGGSTAPSKTSKNTTNELDSLMNDLSVGNTRTAQSTRNTTSELDSLMNDLGGAPTRTGNNNVRNTTNELDSLLNDLSPKPKSTQPAKQSPLDDMMNNIQQPTKQTQTAKGSTNPNSELDSLLQGLSQPNSKSNKVNDDLESLMIDLQTPSVQHSASSGAQTGARSTLNAPRTVTSELDNLVADLQGGSGGGKQQPPSSNLDTLLSGLTGGSEYRNDDLNSLLSSMGGNQGGMGHRQSAFGGGQMGMGGQTGNQGYGGGNQGFGGGQMGMGGQTGNQGFGGGMGGQTGNQGFGGGNNDLDRIMDQLNAPTPSGRNLGGVQGMGVDEGVCFGCRRMIAGEVIQALGKKYHPEHFMCTSCGALLGAGNFYEQEGQPQCENCFHNHFSMRCAACGLPVTNQVLTALDQYWHPHCFVCTNCLGPFVDGNFFEKDSRPYCSNCYFQVFAPRCRSCDQAIQGPCVNALGAQWHPDHFVCHYCKRRFPNGAFYDIGGMPYCEAHYQLHQQRVMQGLGGLTPGARV